jgi:hypothetical protein
VRGAEPILCIEIKYKQHSRSQKVHNKMSKTRCDQASTSAAPKRVYALFDEKFKGVEEIRAHDECGEGQESI